MKNLTKAIALILVSFCLLGSAEGQSKLWENVKIRKTFESKTDDDNKAAIMSFTLPKDLPNSFLINAGIGIDLPKTTHLTKKAKIFTNTFDGFFVYNQNTLIDAKQHNYKLGITSNQVFFREQSPKKIFAIFGMNTAEYLRDYMDTSHSLVVTSYWHPLLKNMGPIALGGYAISDHTSLFNIAPQVGIEYQNILSANSSNKKGYDLRGFFSMGLNMLLKKKDYYSTADIKENKLDEMSHSKGVDTLLFKDAMIRLNQIKTKQLKEKKFWPKLAELAISYSGRLSFVNNNSNFDAYLPLFTAELNIFPLPNDKFSFGISFNDGSNPIDGTKKQTYWLFAIKFKK